MKEKKYIIMTSEGETSFNSEEYQNFQVLDIHRKALSSADAIEQFIIEQIATTGSCVWNKDAMIAYELK